MRSIPGKVHVSRRGRLNLPEVALARGPAAEADTGDGSLAALYGYEWALVWDDLRDPLLLYRLDGGEWVEQTPPEPLPELTTRARHVALAFDRSARAVIAWQGPDGIYVRQWDGPTAEYIVRGPFVGHDPVLVFDGLPRALVGGSDVVLYHLTTDRRDVVARLERDLYGELYPVANLERSDLYLDQLVRLPYRVRLELATDEVADPALDRDDQDLERLRLESDLYPIPVSDEAGLEPAAPAGAYSQTTFPYEAPDDEAGLEPAAPAGAYTATTALLEVDDEAGLEPAAPAGAYTATTALLEVDDEAGLEPTAPLGAYAQTTFSHEASDDEAGLEPAAPTGRYQQT